MRALASKQLNPMIIPPDILRNILQKVQEDIKTNARLKLPDDPIKNIWNYYGTTKLTPIVLRDCPNAHTHNTSDRYFFANEYLQSP